MIHKDSIPIAAFRKHIDEAFDNLFPQKLISTLANMLAIDFFLHKNDKPDFFADARAAECIKNIRAYLNSTNQQFDESFGSSIILFSVAISPPQNINHIDSVNQLQNKDLVVSTYTEAHMTGLSEEEIESMSDALSLLMESADADSVLDFITNDPKLLTAITVKHTSQMRKVRAQLIANEVLEAHAAKSRSAKKSAAATNILTMQSLIQDLAKHTRSEEYNKPKVSVAPKGVVATQRL